MYIHVYRLIDLYTGCISPLYIYMLIQPSLHRLHQPSLRTYVITMSIVITIHIVATITIAIVIVLLALTIMFITLAMMRRKRNSQKNQEDARG